jgi:very-long-chain (3R)-3-hydroxyacyl-CoA dehydratase
MLTCLKGLIKSPVSTTALQVVTRVIQVWMVWYSFPSSTASSSAYLALLLAWSVADTIRYVYLAMKIWGKAPRGLLCLRYVSQSPPNNG